MLVLAIVLLAVTLLSSACNDMLLELGESGTLSIGVGDASLGALHVSLSVDDEQLSEEPEPYVVESGKELTVHAELIDLTETNRFQDSTTLYVWHLNGRSVPGEEETITVDSSELATGEYRLQVWVIVGLTDLVYFTDQILFTVE